MSKGKRKLIAAGVALLISLSIFFLFFYKSGGDEFDELFNALKFATIFVITVSIAMVVATHYEEKADFSEQEEKCSICGEPLKYSESLYKLSNGYLCGSCYAKVTFCSFLELPKYSSNNIDKYIKTKESLSPIFRQSRRAGANFAVDDNHEIIKLGSEYLRFSQVVDFEKVENFGESVIKGGKKQAAVGAIIAGAPGAIIGAAVADRTSSAKCTERYIVLYLNDYITQSITVNFLENLNDFNDCCAILKSILKKEEKSNETVVATVSAADELLKFKNLLDSGVISQEDFDKKKQQLLNL